MAPIIANGLPNGHSVIDHQLGMDLDQLLSIDVHTKNQSIDNERRMHEIGRTFISDTVTAPTKEMQAYAVLSSLGDDVYHDPATAAIEAHLAKITGKEAALYMPSGTMSNQVALRCHLVQPPHSVLCDYRAHVYKYEAGGMAFHSQASPIALHPSNALYLTAADIESELILDSDIHFAQTKVISLENPLNGIILPQGEILAIAKIAKDNNLKLHLDGARLWHVAVETKMPLGELCQPFDSVSLCFSKGLGAPVGSCLVGSAPFIAKARAFRKLFGGGMRQTGYLAATAAFAITHNFPRLTGVHTLAKRLADSLLKIGVAIIAPVDTCMVFYDPSRLGLMYEDILDRAASLPDPIRLGGSRLVVHIQTTEQAVEDLLTLIKTMAQEKANSGFIPPPLTDMNGYAPRNIYVRPKKKTQL